MLRNEEKNKGVAVALSIEESSETDTDTDTNTDCFSSDNEEWDMEPSESQESQIDVFNIEGNFKDREIQMMEANAAVLQAEITCKLMEGINEEWSALRNNNNKRKN